MGQVKVRLESINQPYYPVERKLGFVQYTEDASMQFVIYFLKKSGITIMRTCTEKMSENFCACENV